MPIQHLNAGLLRDRGFDVRFSSFFAEERHAATATGPADLRGDRAVRQKNYKLAIEKYTQALALVADNPYAHFWRGTANYYLWQDGVKALAPLETQRKAETNEARQKELDAQIAAQQKENRTVADNALNELTVALSQFLTIPLQSWLSIHFVKKHVSFTWRALARADLPSAVVTGFAWTCMCRPSSTTP